MSETPGSPPRDATGAATPAPAQADRTPFVFRRRGVLFGLCFLVAIYGAALLKDLQPFPHLRGILSLPEPYLVGPHASGLPTPTPSLVVLVPLLFFALACLARGWGTSYLRGHVMVDIRLHSDRLIIAGPFRWVRNPLYLGNLAMGVGFGLFFAPPTMPLLVLCMLAVGAVVARAEGAALRREFGPAYDAYASRVHAFLPTPPAKDLPPGSPVKPDWRNGFLTEGWSLLMGLYLACLSLRWTVAAQVFGVAAFAAAAWRLWLRRTPKVHIEG